MKIAVAFFILFPFLSMCTVKEESVKLTITNRSNSEIDSVKVQGFQTSLGKILPGDTKTITVDIPKAETYREGMSGMFIYTKGKTYHTSWGFHDWGVVAEKIEQFYVFNNGVNKKDEDLKKPEVFSLYLSNKSGLPIDSIVTDAASLKKTYKREIHWELQFDFSEFEKNPAIDLFQQRTKYRLRINHDWENCNLIQEVLYLYPEGKLLATELKN